MSVLRTILKRNVALLLSSQLVSTMGSIMQTIALSLYVLSKTGSAVTFASVLAVAIVPRLFGPFTGVLTDRVNRKRMLVVLDIIASAVTFCFAVWHQFFGGLLIPCVYLLVLMLSAVQTFYDPTVSAIIPEIAGKDALEETNSASSFISNLAYIAAAAVAGFLYMQFGLFAVMVVNALSFVVAAAFESFMRYRAAPELNVTAQEPVFKAMKEGITAVFGNREMALIVVISIIANLALNPIFTVGMPFIIKKVLGMTDDMYGVSQAMLFIGPVIGSVAAGLVLKRSDYRKMLTWILVIDSALIAVLAALTAFGQLAMGTLLLFLLINVTALLIVSTIVLASIALSTALQKLAPVQLLGRVSGVDASFSLMAIPLGQMLFGLGTSALSPQLTLLAFGGMSLVTGLVAFILYRPMLRAESAKTSQSI